MSYVRTYTGYVSGSESVSASYPASQHGGSHTVTVRYREPVHIEILVDTDPFDHSVSNCNHTVAGLTASIAGMNAAQVAALHQSATRVSDAVTEGFFGLAANEIAQQMTELAGQLPTLMAQLKTLRGDCAGKREQMLRDFHRISERYTTLFIALDQELKTRVSKISAHAFHLLDAATGSTDGIRYGTTPANAMISGGELPLAEVHLAMAQFKRNALQTLQRIGNFILLEKRMKTNFQRAMERNRPSADIAEKINVPVLLMAADSLDEKKLVNDRAPLPPKEIPAVAATAIIRDMKTDALRWHPMEDETREKISRALLKKSSEWLEQGTPDQRRIRIAKTIQALWDNCAPQSL